MKRSLALLLAISGWAAPANSQDAAQAFLGRARAATEKYKDQSVAIVDGYRPIGRDFPAMGEHWIRINLLFDGTIDPEHPEVLTYIKVAGKPEFLGVAYALPLLPGETAPDAPAGKDAWHDHFRSVEDETLLPQHHLHGTIPAGRDEPRLAMLHAWLWAPNPNGVFAADNWAIPYLRLGLTPGKDALRAEALALSLLSGGADYFGMAIDAVALPNAKQKREIAAAFARAESAVESAVRNQKMSALGEVWRKLWKSIESAIDKQARDHLRMLIPMSDL